MNSSDTAAGMIAREELNRMRWAARRGMLELDLVLEPFVESRYPQLSAQDRRRFQRLMQCEDQELYAWLMQRAQPQSEELAGVVRQILQFTRAAAEDR